jgi:hypothetical protein
LQLEPGLEVGRALEALAEEIEAGEVATVDEARAFLLVWQRRRAQETTGEAV